jgi:predicted extracellular nuclease
MKRLLIISCAMMILSSLIFAQTIVTIADIQDTTGTGSDASRLKDSTVTVVGVVSAESYAFGSYYIQDGTGPWSGIMVYDSNNDAAYGDSIMITAEVAEYYNLTELKNVSSFAVLSKGHKVEPTLVTSGEIGTGGANAEAYEGVLVKVVNATITNPDLGYGEWEIDDGSGACRVDDKAEYYFDPAKYDGVKSIVGVLDYSFNDTKIQPRLAYDIEETGESMRIQRLQQVRKSAVLAGNDSSLFIGDTLTISGIVTVQSGLMYAGDGKKYYLQQSGGGPWSGIMVFDYFSTEVPTVFEGDSISVTGYVDEYWTDNYPGNTTEFWATKEIFLWSSYNDVPEPVEVTTSIFNDSLYYDGIPGYEPEKYENVLMRVSSVTVDSVNTWGDPRVNDNTGRGLWVNFGYSDSVSLGAPNVGTLFESIVGVLYHHWGVYELLPRYDYDIRIAVGPPMISNTGYSPSNPQPEDAITIFTSILDDGTITEAKLFYSVNSGTYTALDLVNTTGSGYEAEIGPFANKDTIQFYITATDNDANSSTDPEGAPDSVYTFVISGPEELTIYEIQYTDNPLSSPYVGQLVQFTGTITADTATTTKSFHVQDFDNAAYPGAAWNGIMIYSSTYNKYAIGEKVEIVGSVKEYYGLTEIVDVVSVDKVGTGDVIAEVVTSADIAADSASSEPYEGTLVRINDVTVNEILSYGDFAVTDAAGLIVQIGGSDAYDYTPVVGDKIEFITGNLTYSYDKYEVLLRSNADMGTVTVKIDEDNNGIPSTYSLNQNYPNPFNPTTNIQYGIAKEGLVTLTIYNIMGQEVKTLVNTNQNGGTYKVAWNGLDNHNRMVPNGVYIYRIISDNFVKSKKMIFLK